MKNDLIVIVPIYKSKINHKELISLNRCEEILSDEFPICFVCPFSLNLDEYKLNEKYLIKRFDDIYFKDIDAYNKLMLSSFFYEEFVDYNWMLIYQLDCYIFKNTLHYFTNLGIDYIGAPIYKYKNNRYLYELIGVGNGGLSLRKINSFIDVFKSKSKKSIFEIIKFFIIEKKKMHKSYPKYNNLFFYIFYIPKSIYDAIKFRNDFPNSYINKYKFNEDVFYCNVYPIINPKFKIAKFSDAIKFSFEVFPEKLYELNSYQLPMGCHAWEKNNLEFWKKFIKF